MKLLHAKHNEKACKHLKDEGAFNDWVITTAFYSAIHYIEHELFPKQYSDPIDGKVKNFKDFEAYYLRREDRQANKHKIRQVLVEEYIPEISDSYQTLKENCWNARYVSYKFDTDVSDLCYKCLLEIKDICDDV